MIEIGSVLHDTYRIDANLGRGGMGIVFRASHLRIPRAYAIKVLRQHADDLDSAFARFRREAEISSKLGHPNIIEVHDYNRTADGYAYYVMEYLEGEDLAAHLKRAAPLSIERVLQIIEPVGSALQATHASGVVHRDLKPENIFLCRKGAAEVVKVLDFGVSKIQGSVDCKTESDVLVGTPCYMSPEQASGQSNKVDGRSDQFALAAIIYEMLSGRLPFGDMSEPPYATLYRIVNQQMPPLYEAPKPVAAVIAKALAKAPEQRYADITAFVEALKQAATKPALPSAEPAPTRKSTRWLVAAMIAATTAAALAAAQRHAHVRPPPALPTTPAPPMPTTIGEGSGANRGASREPVASGMPAAIGEGSGANRGASREPVASGMPVAIDKLRPPVKAKPDLPKAAPIVKLPLEIAPNSARVVLTDHDGTRHVLSGPWSASDARVLSWASNQRPKSLRIEAAGYRAFELPIPDGEGVLAPAHVKLARLRPEPSPRPAPPHNDLSYPWK
jgi:serine/threonine-protein kinase